jgi:hypothetical protein
VEVIHLALTVVVRMVVVPTAHPTAAVLPMVVAHLMEAARPTVAVQDLMVVALRDPTAAVRDLMVVLRDRMAVRHM